MICSTSSTLMPADAAIFFRGTSTACKLKLYKKEACASLDYFMAKTRRAPLPLPIAPVPL